MPNMGYFDKPNVQLVKRLTVFDKPYTNGSSLPIMANLRTAEDVCYYRAGAFATPKPEDFITPKAVHDRIFQEGE
jgi:hypothetical protein